MARTFLIILSFVLLFCGGNIANLYVETPHAGTPSKYVYAVISYSRQELVPGEIINRPYGPPDVIAPHYKTVKKQWVSAIEEFKAFGSRTRSKFLDRAESSFQSEHENVTIIKKQCFDFKSYAEAFKDIEYRKDEDVQQYTARNMDVKNSF